MIYVSFSPFFIAPYFCPSQNSSRSLSLKIWEPTQKPRLFGGLQGTSSSKDKGKMKMIEEEDEDTEDDD